MRYLVTVNEYKSYSVTADNEEDAESLVFDSRCGLATEHVELEAEEIIDVHVEERQGDES